MKKWLYKPEQKASLLILLKCGVLIRSIRQQRGVAASLLQVRRCNPDLLDGARCTLSVRLGFS